MEEKQKAKVGNPDYKSEHKIKRMINEYNYVFDVMQISWLLDI